MSNEYGAIPLSTANAVGASLKKKMGSLTGYAPVDWAETINKLGNKLPERTVSGAVCSFSDGADDVPMPSVKASITAVQAGSGDPSPSNVRAISGYTGMNVTRTGKNLLDINSVVQGGLDENTGAETTSSTVKRSGWIKVKANTTYVLSNITNVRPYYYGAGQTSGFISRDSVTSSTFTTPASCVWLRLQAANSSWSGANIQLEEGSTATTYESYAGETIPVSFGGQTIYGGELNLTTGVLTVNRQGKILNGSEDWKLHINGQSTTIFKLASAMTIPNQNYQICSHFTFNANAHLANDTRINTFVQGVSGNLFIQIDKTLAETVEAFKTWLASNNVTYVAGLSATTIQLTSEEVRSFLGTNNLWANTGDSEVTYFAQPSGGITPVFTEEVICDNSSASSTLTFTEDWHDYDFLQFKLTNSSSGIITYITTTPDILDEIFSKSSSKVLFNEFSNDQYALYTKSSDLSWSRSGTRNVNVTEVKGLTATNCTVSTEWIYKRGAITASNVTITAPKYFEAYDEIYMASCDGDSDDTMPCILPVRAGCAGYNFYGNNGRNCVRLTGNTAADTYGKDETKNIFAMMGINYEEV